MQNQPTAPVSDEKGSIIVQCEFIPCYIPYIERGIFVSLSNKILTLEVIPNSFHMQSAESAGNIGTSFYCGHHIQISAHKLSHIISFGVAVLNIEGNCKGRG